MYIGLGLLWPNRVGANFGFFADASLPFLPWSILFYAVQFVMPVVALRLIRNSLLIQRLVWAYLGIAIICAITVAFLPVRMPRPGIPTQENFFYWCVALLYVVDKPVHSFPNVWFALTSLGTAILIQQRLRVGLWFALFAVLGAAASLTIRQHSLADVAAGGLLSGLIYFFAFRRHVKAETQPLSIQTMIPVAYFLAIVFTVILVLFESGLRFDPVLPVN